MNDVDDDESVRIAFAWQLETARQKSEVRITWLKLKQIIEVG